MSLLSNVFHFFMANRRTGTSTLIKELADKNDVYILVANLEEEKRFGEKAISIGSLRNMEGKIAKPVLVDNFTMIELAEKGCREIEELQKKVKARNKFILDMKNLIANFERENETIVYKY